MHFAEQLGLLGEFTAAREILERVSASCREAGVQLLAWTLSQLAALEVSAGNWPAALPRAQEALEFAEEVGDTAIGFCHALKAHVHGALGDESAARAELAEARRTVKGLDGRHVDRAEAFLELSLGNAAAAHGLLSSSHRLLLNPSELAWSLPNLIDASVAVGELDRAATELAEFEGLVEALDRPLLRAGACRCRGRIADASGNVEAALAAFEDALRWHDRVDQRFERARTLLALGVTHRRARHKRIARETLDEARRDFDDLGAEPWAAQARAELARIGGRAGSPTELTPNQRRIADLVAEGKTNSEVAAILVVADRTVESALTQIYRKLDVRSRTELAHKLAAKA